MKKQQVTTPLLFLFALLGLMLLIIVRGSQGSRLPTPSIPDSAYVVMSNDEYEQLRDDYLVLMEQQSPIVVFQRLEEAIVEGEPVASVCHELLHEIGRSAYIKYGDIGTALSYQNELCTSGYMHGAFEGYFESLPDRATSTIVDALDRACGMRGRESLVRWECFHGVGHGLMFMSNNNLVFSIAMCESQNDAHDTSACVNGVYMENFNADQQAHPSKFLDAANPFPVCAIQKDAYKYDCYMNAPIALLNEKRLEYRSALDACGRVENKFRNACFYGIGAQSARRNIGNPKAVEAVCLNVSERFVGSCIDGAAMTFMQTYDSSEKAFAQCALWSSEKYRRQCREVVEGAL